MPRLQIYVTERMADDARDAAEDLGLPSVTEFGRKAISRAIRSWKAGKLKAETEES